MDGDSVYARSRVVPPAHDFSLMLNYLAQPFPACRVHVALAQ